MTVRVDPEIAELAEFMQLNFPASRLVPLSLGMAQLAPVLWGHFDAESVAALSVNSDHSRCEPKGAT